MRTISTLHLQLKDNLEGFLLSNIWNFNAKGIPKSSWPSLKLLILCYVIVNGKWKKKIISINKMFELPAPFMTLKIGFLYFFFVLTEGLNLKCC